MNDPWAAFETAAGKAETAGYFEIAPRDGAGEGRAVWFADAASVREIRPHGDLREEAEAIARFLDARPRGAAIGFLGFDAVGLHEPRLRRVAPGDPFPRGGFALVEEPHRVRVPAHALGDGLPRRDPGRPRDDSLPRARYERGVARLIEDIRAGEAYQVVLAHRRTWARPADLVRRAGRLRRSERFAFFYYLKSADREIVGASPESVAEVHGAVGRINPIAGTIPRGAGSAGRRPLHADPKELAEHRMLVDLARNDLGAVSRAGTVRLRSRERVERYARLDHLVTRVEGRLRPGVGSWDVLAAAFPAGTVVGAPKIRATELLRREEASWRGVYGGTIALLESGNRASWALAIRTGFAAGSELYTAAGAGIVHRSEPRREFNETLVKLAQVEGVLAR